MNDHRQLTFSFYIEDSNQATDCKSLNVKIDDAKLDDFLYVHGKYIDWFVDRIPGLGRWCYRYYDLRLWIKSTYQKLRYGVSNEECWCLDYTLTQYILPRLKHFKKMNRYGVPPDISSVEWEDIIDEIIWTFEYMADDEKFNPCPSLSEAEDGIRHFNRKRTLDEDRAFNNYFFKMDELNKRKERGLLLFAKWYEHLWD